MYKVYFSEQVEYEEYVEASSEDEAIKMFTNSLNNGDLQPIDVNTIEFDVEETKL
jgi:hypothetical protein